MQPALGGGTPEESYSYREEDSPLSYFHKGERGRKERERGKEKGAPPPSLSYSD